MTATDNSTSRLYSEKAYVLSRGFVRRALELPPGDLETELKWLYFTNGRLKKILDDARALVAKSKSQAEDTEAEQQTVEVGTWQREHPSLFSGLQV